MTSAGTGGLTAFQTGVAQAFFSLAASSGFRLAGGAALLALRLSDRKTRDLDLFTDRTTVEPAMTAFVEEATRRGWAVQVVRRSATFCQMMVTGDDEGVLVDLAVDAPALLPAVATEVGTTYDPEEIAGQKTLALFNRAAERDFVDVRALVEQFGSELLLDRAREIDSGFDPHVLAEMIDMLARFTDDELPTDQPDELRAFFAEWAVALRRR